MRDEPLDRETFSFQEAEVLIQRWRCHYTHGRERRGGLEGVLRDAAAHTGRQARSDEYTAMSEEAATHSVAEVLRGGRRAESGPSYQPP